MEILFIILHCLFDLRGNGNENEDYNGREGERQQPE